MTAKGCWHQRWESFLHLEGTELPFRPWTTMEEGIQLVRELGMLDWICREPPPPLPEPERLVPEDVPFTQGLQRRLRAAALAGRPAGQGRDGAGGGDGDPDRRRHVGLLWHQSQPGCARLMLGPNPTCKDLMGWLLSHGMPKERVDRQPTKIFLELYIQEARRSHTRDAFGPGEEQPPCPPYSDQACGAEPRLTRPPGARRQGAGHRRGDAKPWSAPAGVQGAPKRGVLAPSPPRGCHQPELVENRQLADSCCCWMPDSVLRFSLLHFGLMGMVGGPPPLCHMGF